MKKLLRDYLNLDTKTKLEFKFYKREKEMLIKYWLEDEKERFGFRDVSVRITGENEKMIIREIKLKKLGV